MNEIETKTVSEIYPAHWLKASVIKGSEITLTISDVRIEYREGIGKAVLSFHEIVARWMLNSTNAETIATLYGERFIDWIGKRITIYKTSIPYSDTGSVTALRIKPAKG